MIELQIFLEVLPGKEEKLKITFSDIFVPAVSIQQGFISVHLLKYGNAMRCYQIQLRFETEQMRLAWVASDEHQDSFPRLAELCSSVSWQGFELVN